VRPWIKRSNLSERQAALGLLLLVLVLGASLRFYGLEAQSLWNDELATWNTGSAATPQAVISEVWDEGQGSHPPGYYLFMHYSQQYFGDSEAALRASSAVAGVLTILVMYALGTRLYSRREGLIAAAFTAVLWTPVYYSQEARMYAFLILFSALTALFWFAIREGVSAGRWPLPAMLGYAASAIAVSYVHYFGLYLVTLQAALMLLFSLTRLRALAVTVAVYALVLLAYLPWLRQFADRMLYGSNEPVAWIPDPGQGAFLQYMIFLFDGSWVLLAGVLVLYAFAAVCGLHDLLSGRAGGLRAAAGTPGALLLLWLVVPFAGVYALSYVSESVLLYRALLISLPAAYLLLARSITRLDLRPGVEAGAVGVAVIGLAAYLVFGAGYYTEPTKAQFRESVEFVMQREETLESAVMLGCAHDLDYFRYYFSKMGSSQEVRVAACAGERAPRILKLLDRVEPRYVWYLRADRSGDAELLEELRANGFRQLAGQQLYRAEAVLFENTRRVAAGG
jgi:mannosyltransferase